MTPQIVNLIVNFEIVTQIQHHPWESVDPEPQVQNLQIILMGYLYQPADDPHSWCALPLTQF
jgi:hypothetical protein